MGFGGSCCTLLLLTSASLGAKCTPSKTRTRNAESYRAHALPVRSILRLASIYALQRSDEPSSWHSRERNSACTLLLPPDGMSLPHCLSCLSRVRAAKRSVTTAWWRAALPTLMGPCRWQDGVRASLPI